MKLFLAGDVMTGRGIDQVLPHPADPELHEPYVRTARRYVALAEEANGPIDVPVSFDYVWGDALPELERADPTVRIINLETAVTTSDDWWKTKGIHYRMHPANVPVLAAPAVDLCVLANNHVLDWGTTGLRETLATLADAGIRTVGAGRDARAARMPATLEIGTEAGTEPDRLVVHAWGTPGAGVSSSWAAGADQPGVNVLRWLDPASADGMLRRIEASHEQGDRVIVSIHWGGNWGYEVPREQRALSHRLIDSGLVDLVFGHSSHHPKGMEVYRERLILYGVGDFINDYEGIGGRDEYRGDLVAAYFPELEPSGALRRLVVVPFRIRRFRLERPSAEDVAWLAATLDRECRPLGCRVRRRDDDRLELAVH